jgi:pullulanase/glycogen debranching enzyme
VGDTLFLAFNAHPEATRFVLPSLGRTHRWERLLDTSEPAWDRTFVPRGREYVLPSRSVAVFKMSERP